MKIHTEGEQRVERRVSIQPRAVDNGEKGPYPFHIDSEGLVGEQDRWNGEPSMLEGFVWEADTTGRVDLDFEDFWRDPTRCLGMHPVFTHEVEGEDDSIFTHGDKTIAHVSVVEQDGHVSLRVSGSDEAEMQALALSMETKAREYDDMMAAEASGRVIRMRRSDYLSLLDIAIMMTRLRAGEDVDIDGHLYKLVDANTQPEGSASLMLTSLATGHSVKINGEDHTLIATDELRKLEGQG